MTLGYCPLWDSYRLLFPSLGFSIRAALLAVSSRVLEITELPLETMIFVHMKGDSKMLYRFFILHDTLPLETALRIFAVFVRMLSLYKWRGKEKGEGCLSLYLQNVQVPKPKELVFLMSQCCHSALNLQARGLQTVRYSKGPRETVFLYWGENWALCLELVWHSRQRVSAQQSLKGGMFAQTKAARSARGAAVFLFPARLDK